MLAPQTGRNFLFAAHMKSGTVSVMDPGKNCDPAIIETGAGAEGISISSDGNEAWVTSRADDLLSVIDLEKNEVTEMIECRGFLIRIEHHPNRPRAFVTGFQTGELTIVNTDRRTIIDRFKTGSRPVSLQYRSDDRLFVANTGDESVLRVDTSTGEVKGTISVPDTPDGLALLER